MTDARPADRSLWVATTGPNVRRLESRGDRTRSPVVRYRNPRRARHTFATRWLKRGGRMETLSEAMGHASIATTVDLYGHLDLADVARDLALIERGHGINPLQIERS